MARAIRVNTRKARGTRLLKPLSLKVARAAKRVRATVWVAVIVRQGFANGDRWKYESGRSDDGWYALVGEDKQKLVTEALAKVRGFDHVNGQRYEVAVGRLDEMVVMPTPAFEYVTL